MHILTLIPLAVVRKTERERDMKFPSVSIVVRPKSLSEHSVIA